MRQYRDAKEAYPNAILFFRLGDFYEMFNDDAVVAARELQLTLTSRNKGSPDPVPMAGVPCHAAHGYLTKLLAAGHEVAICEQMADPATVKGIVPRQVVRVLTPGLITDADQLDARSNNYLCAADGEADGDCFGLALLDLSTAELSACTTTSATMLLGEIARAEPREVILPTTLSTLGPAVSHAAPQSTLRDDGGLEAAEVVAYLDESAERPLHADAATVHGQAALRACARVLRFARNHLPTMTLPVRRVGAYDPSSVMRIDETAQAHLELVRSTTGDRAGSLLAVLDNTVTAAGARLLRRRLLAPLTEVRAVRRRLDAVELLVHNPAARQELRQALRRVGDLERLAVRASLSEVTPRELGAVRTSVLAAPAARDAIRSIPDATDDTHSEGDSELGLGVDLLEPLGTLLAAALVDEPPAKASEGGVVRAGYDTQLDEFRQLRHGGSELIASLERRLREQTGIGSLKIKYTRAFGWYIEVTKAHLDKVPSSWRRRQTLTNAERYLDDELGDLADKLIGAEEQLAAREAAVLGEIVTHVASHSAALQRLARAMARWDVAAALAETAHAGRYCRPSVDDGTRIALRDARHPVVERFVAAGQFVPNDTDLDLEGERLWLITGPNMAGKSTLMRQVALATIVAQMGSFVPAGQATIGVVDRVLSRVGASDDLARGESTFMVEMRETAAILRCATRRSLVILDEIGRGTSTFDGLAIAWAVAEYLHEAIGCRAMFATHYHQLTELANHHPAIANYSVSAREHAGALVFLHRLTKGAVSRSYGIAVARLARLPESLLGRAGAVLDSLEGGQPLPDGPGAAASSRPDAQLELFRAPAQASAEQAVAAQLRHSDLDRMTPLEALQLLVELKRALDA